MPLSHPRESPGAGLWGATTRRRFLQRAGLAALAVGSASALSACSDTTVPGGQDPHLAPGGLPLARPDNPVSLPIYPDNPRIPSGLKPESGPLQLYNWAEYVNPAVLKSFEKRYDVEVQLSTFSTLDEAVAKLAAGAVGYDVFVPTQPEISLLVAGKLIQPLNLNYVPNLRKNVWKMLRSPWYDVGSHYTVPYTVFSTGIAWRNDFLPDYDPSKLANPYESFWQATDISGKVAMLDDQREGLAMGLLRNGITDVNTGSRDQVDGAKEAIQELTDLVNLRFYTNDYQHIADGSIWLHQAWGGDMTAIGYYLPKGTPVTAISYWWPQDGRGLMGNDTMAVLKGAPHPVLAHLFINHVLDVETAFLNMEFTGYQQPLVEMTPEAVVEEELVPENLLSAIVREGQFSKGFLQGPLSAEGMGIWETAWSEVKAT
ncbi:MAG TPA: spermidine/putrescine ABC transporter substrate-binding protein [Solirubrobacterales bacterium]|nr:spermidine/putrescine ABC transporter substrate-binding protein [Solirubrobacterales bacterium]